MREKGRVSVGKNRHTKPYHRATPSFLNIPPSTIDCSHPHHSLLYSQHGHATPLQSFNYDPSLQSPLTIILFTKRDWQKPIILVCYRENVSSALFPLKSKQKSCTKLHLWNVLSACHFLSKWQNSSKLQVAYNLLTLIYRTIKNSYHWNQCALFSVKSA